MGCVAAGSKKRARVVTLDDLWAEWGAAASWWFDGDHGVDVMEETWTDRVSGRVLTADVTATLAPTTIEGAAENFAGVELESYADCPAHAAFASTAFRAFFVLRCEPMTADYMLIVGDGATFDWYITSDDAADESSAVGNITNYSVRKGVDIADSTVRVVRLDYNGTHASHVLKVNGVSFATAGWESSDIALPVATPSMRVGGIGGDAGFRSSLMLSIPWASMTGGQADTLEADLRTMMGV
jgi:hypothetical protein